MCEVIRGVPFEHLKKLEMGFLSELFQSEQAAQFVFGHLSSSEQNLVLRLLFSSSQMTLKELQSPSLPGPSIEQNQALLLLKQLSLIRNDGAFIILHPCFETSFRSIISQESSPHPATLFFSPTEHHLYGVEPSAIQRWELFLLGLCETRRATHKETLSSLLEPPSGFRIQRPTKRIIGAVAEKSRSRHQRILLADTGTQIWTLLFNHVGIGVSDLCFLFSLEEAEEGVVYAVEKETALLDILCELGAIIILTHGQASRRYFVITTLVRALFQKQPRRISESQLGVIVETNFRVYLYTNNDLEMAIFRLFVLGSEESCFGASGILLSGRLSQEGIQEAFRRHIKAEQLISFLELKAHATMGQKLPPNVSAQIQLWERETERIRFVDAFFLQGFGSIEEFQNSEQSYRSRGLLLFADRDRDLLVIKKPR